MSRPSLISFSVSFSAYLSICLLTVYIVCLSTSPTSEDNILRFFFFQCLQTMYFGLCVINLYAGSDIPASRSPKQRSGLQTFRDLLHSTLAFPVGMVRAHVLLLWWFLSWHSIL